MKASQLIRALEQGKTLQHKITPEYEFKKKDISTDVSQIPLWLIKCLASIVTSPGDWRVKPMLKVIRVVLVHDKERYSFTRKVEAARFLGVSRQYLHLAIIRGTPVKGYQITIAP